MTRRDFLFLTVPAVSCWTPNLARADEFTALWTKMLRGDPAQLGWSTLQVGFRVQFPAPASGRKFMEQQYKIIDAVERELGRTPFDPTGDVSQRQRLERVIDAAVRRAAPRGSVSRVYDFRIEASE